MKFLHYNEREALIAELFTSFYPILQREMMDERMVRELFEAGHEIGAHTVSHEILSTLSDDDALYQIARSKHDLEAVTGNSIRYFCYPNGLPGRDFTVAHEEMVRSIGFEAGFSTRDGGVSAQTNPMSIPRFLPYRKSPLMRTLSTAKIMGETEND